MAEVKLSRPLLIKPSVRDTADKEVEPAKFVDVLVFDFDALTGADFCIAEREALAENANIPPIDPRLSPAFQAHIASRACGVPVQILRGLGMRDYCGVLMAVRDFFAVAD